MTNAQRRILRMAAPILGVALLATSCGGKSKESSGGDVGDPVRGGSLAYAIEAESESYCLPEASLAISGITVVRAIYDPLTAPNADGKIVPYLAESVVPDDDYTQWTITLRDGVVFHDGTPLTADVVRNNLDAYRGQVGSRSKGENVSHPTRSPLLFSFTLQQVDDVQVTGDLEVTITTTVPWVDFPAALYAGGRMGMMAQSQIDDEATCDTKMVGTGPFELERWRRGQDLVASANPDYWQDGADGEPYPYLDEIRFVPIPETEQRVNALEAGDIDLLHDSRAGALLTLEGLAGEGAIDIWSTNDKAETGFVQMNDSKPPFDDQRIRRAIALSLDREAYKEANMRGRGSLANGPFPPGSVGYLEDTGLPSEPDLEEARELIADYEADEGDIGSITFTATNEAYNQETAIFVQQSLEAVGVTVDLATVQQSELVSTAISGDFEMMPFRLYGGGIPDTNYVWWYSGGPANFPRIADPEIDRLLDEGRSEPDEARRKEIYEAINRRFGEQAWILPLSWITWTLASQPTVHGYDPDTAPDLPDGSRPSTGMSDGHFTLGVWVDA